MGYRDLLKKYMELIIQEESVSYLNRIGGQNNIKFTEFEMGELRKMEKAIKRSRGIIF